MINTGTTIVTFLMVFHPEHSELRCRGRPGQALRTICATQGAHNTLLNLEDMEASELDEVRQRYAALAEQARLAIEKGQQDTDAPDVGGMRCALRTDRVVERGSLSWGTEWVDRECRSTWQ